MTGMVFRLAESVKNKTSALDKAARIRYMFRRSTTNRKEAFMPPQEQVLVFERKIFDEAGPFHGLKFDIADFLKDLFAPGVLRFMARPEAEADPSYKQLIPYVIMACGDKYLTYIRGKRAGEKRLLGNRSIGIGGHINPIDNPLFGMKEMYETAVQREIEEEVTVETNYTDKIVALLNDDTNEVGKVHLGVVHFWQLEEEKVTRREQMITQMTFMDADQLGSEREAMETWSQLCFDGLEKMK
jgi:predicted NUDIX family phosphoesterase